MYTLALAHLSHTNKVGTIISMTIFSDEERVTETNEVSQYGVEHGFAPRQFFPGAT